MAYTAYLPILCDRYGALVRHIFVAGLDLTGVDMRAQVRWSGDTPGPPLVDLRTVSNGNAQGLRLVEVTRDDNGLPTSHIEIVINETTIEALPYQGEIGDATQLAWDMQITLAGRKRRLAKGEFEITGDGVTGAEVAPSARVQGYGRPRQPISSPWKAARLAFGEEQVTVQIVDADLVAPLAQDAKSARDQAEAFSTSAGQKAASADLAASGAMAAANLFPTVAAGLAATAPDAFFTVVGDNAATFAILYRKTNGSAVEQARYASKAAYEGPGGAAFIGFANTEAGASTRSLLAVMRDAPFNPKNFGAIGDAQRHPLSERFATLAAAQAVYPFLQNQDEYGTSWRDQSSDSMAIDAALNAASANPNIRGTVRLPLGYYVLSKPIKMPSFCTFEGESRYGSVLYNQGEERALNAPQIVNKDPAGFVGVTIAKITCYGGTHAIKIAAGEVSQVAFTSVLTALQTVSAIEANTLQTTEFADCIFGPPGSGYAINVTGFPCNAITLKNVRASCGKSGLLRLRGVDGFHWTSGSMEGNGEWVRVAASVSGQTLNVTSLLDGAHTIRIGDTVTGDGILPGTVIIAFGTGTGGTGTYALNSARALDSRSFYISPATIDIEDGGARATSVSFNHVYFEGTHRVLLRTVGVKGVSIDDCKGTWSANGEPYAFDTGGDVIAIGTTHFDTDVVGPLNMLLAGSSPRVGGNVNTWVAYGQNAGRVVMRSRDVAIEPTFDLMKFIRANPTAGAGNMHTVAGTLTVNAQGYDGNGNPRWIRRAYRVAVRAYSTSVIGASIEQQFSDENISNPPQSLAATVRDASNAELIIQLAVGGFNSGLPSQVYATFDYAGISADEAQRLEVRPL